MDHSRFFSELCSNAHEGIVVLDKGHVISMNPAFKRIFNIQKDEALDVFSDLFFNDNAISFKDANGNSIPSASGPFQRLLRNDVFQNEKYRIFLKEMNTEFYCSFNSATISFGSSSFDVLFVQDLPNQTEHTENSTSDKVLLNDIMDAIPIMLSIYDPDLDEAYLNKGVERTIGWNHEDCEEYGIMTLAYPDEIYRKEIIDFMTCSHDGFRDIVMRTKDGRDIITSWANVQIPDGRKVGVGIDINDQRVVERNLKSNEEKFRNLADNISQHAWMCDSNGNTFWFNKRWYDFTRADFEDVKGMGWTKFVHPDHLQRILVHYRSSIRDGKIWDDTFLIKNHEGEFRWFLSRALPIKDDSGEILSWFGTNTDITEIKKLQEELSVSNRKVGEAMQLQKTFIQNISHEVRTPMNSILGFSELLSKTLSNGIEAEYLDSIRYNGLQLLNLIDDIIDYSRLDSRELDLSKAIIPIDKIFKYLINQFEALKLHFKKDDIVLKINIREEDEDELIYADEYRIQQLLNNLLSNAVKYTEKGFVEIGYRIQRFEKQILFFVKDSGIGIVESQRENIFERFKQSHHGDTKNIRGTGLGLSISRQLAELFGGEIWFESKVGQGSSFFFTYPFDESIEERPPLILKPTSSDTAIPNLYGKKILIAEDDDFSFKLLEAMLFDTKAEVLHASRGEEAVELFNNNHIDLVFLDIRLPGLSGYEILKKIRATDKQVPVIAQSAYAMPEEKKKSFESGFNFHATKPITSNDLYSILNCFFFIKNEEALP